MTEKSPDPDDEVWLQHMGRLDTLARLIQHNGYALADDPKFDVEQKEKMLASSLADIRALSAAVNLMNQQLKNKLPLITPTQKNLN